MTKRIVVERLYNLGDYKNIKFVYEHSDLNDSSDITEVFKEAEAYVEEAFLNYKKLSQNIQQSQTMDEALSALKSYLAKYSDISDEKKGE